MTKTSPLVYDVTAGTFQKEVVERSFQVPVILDFWAPWCGPCRQLGPALEKLVQQHGGKIVLGKVNTDEEQQLAGAFGIQSLPTVFAVSEGRPVDQFVGLLPEADLKTWIERLLPSPAQMLLQEGLLLEKEDPQGAERKYREALALAPDEAALQIRLARVLLDQERYDECRSMLETLEQRGFLEPEAERIKSDLALRLVAVDTGGVAAAREVAAADPSNWSLQIRYGEALAAAKQHQQALEILLQVVQKEMGDGRAEAKGAILKVFDVLGPASELTSEYRRRLATALY